MLSIALVAVVGMIGCKNETKKEVKTETEQTVTKEVALTESVFGVRGNCGMCKNTIETAAKGVTGIATADWDRNKKQIKVAFDASKTDLNNIHKAIAASGYDTDKVMGSEEAYDNLPGCCKYSHEMEMMQSGEKKADEHAGHNH